MKVGIIRCMQTEDYCPGTADFKMIAEKKGAFEGVTEPIEIVGFINCGGCPGKKAVLHLRIIFVPVCLFHFFYMHFYLYSSYFLRNPYCY